MFIGDHIVPFWYYVRVVFGLILLMILGQLCLWLYKRRIAFGLCGWLMLILGIL